MIWNLNQVNFRQFGTILPEQTARNRRDQEGYRERLQLSGPDAPVYLAGADARWVWENARPRDDIMAGRPVHILLNRAGGYRRAQVLIQNLQVCDVLFDTKKPEENEPVTGDTPENTSPLPEENTDDDAEVNYGLIAFEWVDAHVLELNERLNEAIAQGESEFMILEAELPERDSWPEICQELVRNGLEEPECCETGIRITCKQ